MESPNIQVYRKLKNSSMGLIPLLHFNIHAKLPKHSQFVYQAVIRYTKIKAPARHNLTLKTF